MKKLILCASVVALGMMYSCSKDEAIPEGSMPEWLGESIYSELENPTNLTGTFSTYLKLVDDLGYKDVLSQTGSKTIFPANDEAFTRFFASNDWGVSSYEQLTTAQKKVLFYNSMLDNSILIDMLSNVTGGTTTVVNDIAIKHASNISVTDTVTALRLTDVPQNNSYWDNVRARYNGNLFTYIVEDNTKPQIVHFTKNFLTNKGITTAGSGSDFAIITGDSVVGDENTAYVFNDKIIKEDVTCKNGYIHQVQDVLIQPGNMASVLRKEDNTHYFSRIVDYFSAPYYDASTTSSYNTIMRNSGGVAIDSIFQWRYISKRSQGGVENLKSPNGNQLSSSVALKFDPGWNAYYPDHKNAGSVDYTLADIGAMFVPTDDALWNFFKHVEGQTSTTSSKSGEGAPDGSGAYILENYMKPGNTNDKAHFEENLDSLQSQNPGILNAFVNNLMQTQFTASVPSKFSTLTNDATENLGINTGLLQKKTDGKYDIVICNNGVIYKLRKVIAPDEYTAVLAPSSVYDYLTTMNWAIQDRTALGLDFKYYLLAMNANYALFLPDDEAFSTNYYIDPTTWVHTDATGPTAVRFYYDSETGLMNAEVHKYDKTTNTVDPAVQATYSQDKAARTFNQFKTQLIDILNTHTVLLESGETFGANHYYMSKSGAGLYIDKAAEGGNVSCGLSLYNGVKSSTIKHDWSQANGHAYRMDSPIQPTMNSVYATLNPKANGGDNRFGTFFEYVNFFSSAEDVIMWALDKDDSSDDKTKHDLDEKTNTYATDRYKIFYGYVKKNDKNKYRKSCCPVDYNVRLFNTYNYTVYAPNDSAMSHAFRDKGLPSLDDMRAIYETYADEDAASKYSEAVILAKKAQLLNMLEAAQQFIRYHLQTKSVFVDKNGSTGEYSTLYTDDIGVALKLKVTTGGNQIAITDSVSTKYIKSTDKVNLITRDWDFGKMESGTVKSNSDPNNSIDPKDADAINTSSYAVVHELTEVLCPSKTGRYDDKWNTAAKRAYYGKNYSTLLKKINKRILNY